MTTATVRGISAIDAAAVQSTETSAYQVRSERINQRFESTRVSRGRNRNQFQGSPPPFGQPLLGKQALDLGPDACHVGGAHRMVLCPAFPLVQVVILHPGVDEPDDAGLVEQERH